MHFFITESKNVGSVAVPENKETKEGKKGWKKGDTTHNEPSIPHGDDGAVILAFVACFLCVAVCYDDVCYVHILLL